MSAGTEGRALPHFDVAPTYERPGSGAIIVGATVRVAAESADAARDFIAAHLVAARLTPIRIDTTPVPDGVR